MHTVSNTTTTSTHAATVALSFVYVPKGDGLDKGVGFADLFATAEFPAVAAETFPCWLNTVPCLHRRPSGVSYRQARLDRNMLRRVRRELRA